LTPVQAWPFLQDKSGTHIPAMGKLLVAMPSLNSPHFSATVILLLSYSKAGATGLIINRPTQLTLAAEFADQVSEHQASEKLFWGGPVEMNRRVMLVESAEHEDTSALDPVIDSIYLANDRTEFSRLLKQDAPDNRLRVFAGYAGWGPKQLEREIVRGDWLVVPGDAEMVLRAQTDSIWPQLINYKHGRMAALDFNQGLELAVLGASGH